MGRVPYPASLRRRPRCSAMAAKCREDRPVAITAASQSAERPSKFTVTTFSALSSSSDARIRVSNSLRGADLGAATFFGRPLFFEGFFAGFLTAFAEAFFAGFLTVLA